MRMMPSAERSIIEAEKGGLGVVPATINFILERIIANRRDEIV
jgi:hypothetical protein